MNLFFQMAIKHSDLDSVLFSPRTVGKYTRSLNVIIRNEHEWYLDSHNNENSFFQYPELLCCSPNPPPLISLLADALFFSRSTWREEDVSLCNSLDIFSPRTPVLSVRYAVCFILLSSFCNLVIGRESNMF